MQYVFYTEHGIIGRVVVTYINESERSVCEYYLILFYVWEFFIL